VDTVVWIVEGTWRACVHAAQTFAPASSRIVLLHVTAPDVPGAAHGAFAGLLGRGHPERDPGHQVEELAEVAALHLLGVAAAELDLPATAVNRHGRPEEEVIAAAEGAGLLIVARDGDRTRLGPKSLDHATRFVVDHAPCPVLLVWPEQPPGIASIPPPPPR
jgi:nucleotide-binding universal stress UspA family protein